MADNVSGVTLEIGGFSDYIKSFQQIDEAHKDASTSADNLIGEFIKLQLNLTPIPVALQQISSEVASGLGFSNLSANIQSLETTLGGFTSVLQGTLQQLTAFANTPINFTIAALPNITEGTNIFIADADRVIAKVQELNAVQPVDFTDGISLLNSELASFKGAANVQNTFDSLKKTLSGFKSLKNFDEISGRITTLVAAIKQFGDIGTISTASIEALAKDLPLFFNALKSFSNSKTIVSVPTVIQEIGTAFSSFASIGNVTKEFPTFVANFQSLGTVLKDLSSGKGATRLAEILKQLAPAIQGIITAFTGLNSVSLGTVSSTFTEFGNALKDFGLGIKRVSEGGSIDVAIAGIQKLVNLLDQQINVKAFSTAFNTLSTTLKNFADAIKTFTSGKGLDNLKTRVDSIVAALESLSKANLSGFASQLKVVSPQLEKFSEALKVLSSAQNLNVLLKNVDALSTAIGRSSFSFQAFTFIVEKVGGAIASGLGTAITVIGNFVIELGKFIGTNVVSAITAIVNAFISFGQTLVSIPFQVISTGFSLVLKAIEIIISPIQFIIGLFQSLGSIFSSFTGGSKIAADLQQTGTAGGQLDSSIKLLESDLQQYTNATKNAQSGTEQLGGTFQEGEGKLLKFVSTLEAVKGVSGFLSNAFNQLRFGLQSVIGDAFNAAAATEKFQTALTALSARDLVKQGYFSSLGDASGVAAEEAKLLGGALEKLAIISPFSKTDINDAFKLAETYGFTAKEALDLTKNTVDFAVATGQSGSVIGEVTGILGKLNATGKLTSEVANQLAERGFDIRAGLGEAFGLTTEKVQETISKGLVPANVAIAITSKQLEVFKGAAAQAANSLEGIISSAKDLKDKALQQLFVGVFEAFKPFASAINEILFSPEFIDSIQNLGETIKNELLSAVQAVSGPLGTLTGILGVAHDFFSNLNPVVKTIGVEILKVAGIVLAAVAAFGAYNSAITLLGPIIGLFLNPLALTVAAVAGLTIVIYDNIEAITSLGDSVTSYLQPAFDAVSGILPTIGEGFTAFFNVLTSLGSQVSTVGTGISTYLSSAFSNLSSTVSSFIPTLDSLQQSFNTNFSSIQQTVVDSVNGVIDFLSSGLQNFADFGTALIQTYADGIIAGIGVLENAIAEVASAISYLMEPGSPPRFLPDIDDWGKETATVYLDGFNKADFGVIGDFASSIGDVLKSIDGDLVASINVEDIANTFSAAFANFKVTGTIDTSFLDEIAAQAPGAADEVRNLAEQYLQVAVDTSAAEAATKAYNDRLAELQGKLDRLDSAQTFENEAKQLQYLNDLLKNRFLDETQRRSVLNKITQIQTNQEIRGLKDTSDSAEANLKTSQEALDTTKARIALANQLAGKKDATTAGGGASDAADKARKEKLKKEKGAALDLGDAILKANDKLLKLSNTKIDTGPLENFKKSFQESFANVGSTIEGIKTKFTDFRDKLSNLGITFDTVKKAALGLGAILATVFTAKFLAPALLPLLLDLAPAITAVAAGFAAFAVITGKIDLSVIVKQFNDFIDKFNTFSTSFKLPKLDPKAFTDGLLQIQDAIQTFQSSASKGNKSDLLSNLLNFDTTNASTIAASLGAIFNNITTIVSTFITNLKSFTLTDFVTIFFDSLKSLVQLPSVFADAFKNSDGIASGIIAGLEAVGKSILANNPFVKIFQQLFAGINFGDTSFITDFVANLFDFSGITIPLPDFAGIFAAIVNSFPVKVFSEIARIASSFFDQISSSQAATSIIALGNAFSFAATEVSKVLAVLGTLFSVLVGGAIEQLPQIFFSFTDALTATLNILGSFIKSFEDFFKRGSFSVSSFVQLAIDLFHAFSNNFSTLFNGVVGFFDGFNKIIDNAIIILGNLFGFDAKGFLERFRLPITIVESLITGKFLGAIFSAIKGFELFKAGGGVLSKTFSILISPLKLIVSAIQLFFTVINRTLGVLGVFNRSFLGLFSGTTKFGSFFKDLVSIVKTGEPAFSGIAKQATILGKVFGGLGNIFKGIGSLIGKGLNALFKSGDATAVVGDTALLEGSAASIAGGFIETLSSVISTFFKSGALTAIFTKGFGLLALGVGAGIGLLIAAFVKFGPAILEFFTKTIPNLFKSIGGIIFSPENTALIGNSFLLVFSTVGKLLSFVFNNFGTIIKTLLNSSFVKSFIDGFKNIAPKVAAFIPTLIKNLVKLLTEGFVLLAGAALAGLVFVAKFLIENGPQILSGIGNSLIAVGGAIIQGLIDGIDAALAVVGISPKAQEFVDSFLSVIKSGFESIQPYLQPIIDGFNQLVTFVSGLVFPNPFDDLIAVISGTEGIGTALTNISTEFNNLFTQITGLVLPNPFAEIGKVLSGEESIPTALANIVTQFQNLVTQLTGITLPNPFAEIIKVLQGEESIGTALTNIVTQFKQMILDVSALVFPNIFSAITTVISDLLLDINSVYTTFTQLVTDVTGITFPNPFATLITYINGDNGIVTLVNTIVAAFKVVGDFLATETFPNVFADLVSFISGDVGLIPTLEKIEGEFTKVKTFLDTFVLPAVFQALIDTINGPDGLIVLLGNLFTGFDNFQKQFTGISLPNPFEIIYNVLNGPGNISEKVDTLLTAFNNFSAGIAKLTITTTLEGVKTVIDGIKSGVDLLTTGFTTLGTFLDSFSIPNPFSEIGTFLSSISTLLTDAQTGFTSLQTFINGLSFTDPLGAISETLSATKDLVQPLIDAFGELSTFFADFTIPNPFDALTIPDSVKKALEFAGISLGEDTGKAIADSANETTSTELSNKDIKITNSPTTITNATTAGEEIGTSTADGAVQGLNAAGKANETETKSWFQNWVTDPIKSAAGINSPSTEADETIGQPIGQGILQGILTTLQAGDSSLQSALKTLLGTFETFKTDFVNSATDLGSQLSATFASIGQIISSVSFTAPVINTNTATATGGDFSSQFIQKFAQINTAFTTFKVSLSANFMQLFNQINALTTTFLKDEFDLIQTFFQDVLDEFDKFAQDLLAAIAELNRKIINLVKELFSNILKRLQDFFDDFIKIVEDSFKTIVETIEDAFATIKDDFDSFFSDVLNKIGTFLTSVKAKFGEFATILKDAAKAGVDAFIAEIQNGLAQRAISAINLAFLEINIKATDRAKRDFGEIGQAMVDGMIDGLNSRSGELNSAVVRIIEDALKAGKAAAQANSPSKLFSKELGSPLGEGLTFGVLSQTKNVANAFVTVLDNAVEVVKQKYGIHSPSEVIRKALAHNLMGGLNKGIEDFHPIVGKSIEGVANLFDRNFNFGLPSKPVIQKVGIEYNNKLDKLQPSDKLSQTVELKFAKMFSNLPALEQQLNIIPNVQKFDTKLPNEVQMIKQGVDIKYNNLLSSLPVLEQAVNLVPDVMQAGLNTLSARQLNLPTTQSLGTNVDKSSINNSTQINRSLDMSTHRIMTINNNKQYVMNMTVTPERATQVKRNFKVAEFLG